MCDTKTDDKTTTNRLSILLNNQRKTGEFCDIKIFVNKIILYAHSAIMINFSKYIKNRCLLKSGVNKTRKYSEYSLNSPLTIDLNEMTTNCVVCVKSILNFMYLNLVEAIPSHIAHLTELCTFLNIDNVVPLYIKSISKQNETIDDSNKIEENIQKIIKIPQNVQAKKSQCKLHTCLRCHYQCYKPSNLIAHLKTSHCCQSQKTCSLCLMQFDSVQENLAHLEKHDHPKPFFCTSCDQRFQSRTTLSQHIPKHSQETPFVCPHCRKGFKWKHGLTSHLIIHSKEMKHLCDECGFSTAHAKTLRAHKLIHTGDLLRCPYPGCKHSSQRKENLKSHVTTHNKETPFVCEICGHKFSQSKNLKRHSRIHDSNLTHHQCPHRNCGFRTTRTDKLREHIIRQHNSNSDTQKSNGAAGGQLSSVNMQDTKKTQNENKEFKFITFSDNLLQIMDNGTNIFTSDSNMLEDNVDKNIDVLLEEFPAINNQVVLSNKSNLQSFAITDEGLLSILNGNNE